MRQERQGRDTNSIDQLLRELAELRELDRRRQAHAPGSAAHDAATLEVDLRSRRLMDAFRDLQRRRTRRVESREISETQPVDPWAYGARAGGSRLN
jgi:hypothetical protein